MKKISLILLAWLQADCLRIVSADVPVTKVAIERKTNSWSINPIRLLSPLVNTAKTLAPASVRRNIDLLEGLFDVKDAKWSIFHQRVVLDRCTLRLRNQPRPALTIGRLDIHWDSLTTPTVDIEIGDVLINVEFTNMLMSRNNWDELNEGIAPLVTSYESTSRWFGWDKPSEQEDEFLQFNRISLLGNLTLALRSRPLGKELTKLSLKMSVGDLSDKIEKMAEKNLQRHGRRGCTTTDLTNLLKQYFASRLRSLLKEIAKDPQRTIEQKDYLVQEAQALISRCTTDVSTKVSDSMRQQLGNRIEELFLRIKMTIDALFERFDNGIKRIFAVIGVHLFGDEHWKTDETPKKSVK